MITNVIVGDLPDEEMDRILRYLRRILKTLPFLTGLTPAERIKLHPISDGRLPYALKCSDYCTEHYANLGITQEDKKALADMARLFEQLGDILMLVGVLHNALRDTHIQLGSNYFRACRDAHRHLRIALKNGRPGIETIVDELDKLFANQGKRRGPKGPEKPLDPPIFPADNQPDPVV